MSKDQDFLLADPMGIKMELKVNLAGVHQPAEPQYCIFLLDVINIGATGHLINSGNIDFTFTGVV